MRLYIYIYISYHIIRNKYVVYVASDQFLLLLFTNKKYRDERERERRSRRGTGRRTPTIYKIIHNIIRNDGSNTNIHFILKPFFIFLSLSLYYYSFFISFHFLPLSLSLIYSCCFFAETKAKLTKKPNDFDCLSLCFSLSLCFVYPISALHTHIYLYTTMPNVVVVVAAASAAASLNCFPI